MDCSTCRFWDRGPLDSEFGACRRYPPVPIISVSLEDYSSNELDWDVVNEGLINLSRQPKTHSSDWCGEYDPKTETVRDHLKKNGLLPKNGSLL